MYYRVDTIHRLLKIIGLFGKRALWKRWYLAKEIYDLKEPTNRSHPIHSIPPRSQTTSTLDSVQHIWVMTQTWHRVKKYVSESYVIESCICESWVTTRIRLISNMSHVYDYNNTWLCESCHTWLSHDKYDWVIVIYEWVMSNMTEACHTRVSHFAHEWVMTPCQWVMSHASESCHTWVSHDTFDWVMLHVGESCCSMLQCVAVCCSALQCVALKCSKSS